MSVKMDEAYNIWRDGCQMSVATVITDFEWLVKEMSRWREPVFQPFITDQTVRPQSSQRHGVVTPRLQRRSYNHCVARRRRMICTQDGSVIHQLVAHV